MFQCKQLFFQIFLINFDFYRKTDGTSLISFEIQCKKSFIILFLVEKLDDPKKYNSMIHEDVQTIYEQRENVTILRFDA